MSLYSLAKKLRAQQVKYDVQNCHNAVANFLDKVTEALILKGKPDKVEGSGMLYTV